MPAPAALSCRESVREVARGLAAGLNLRNGGRHGGDLGLTRVCAWRTRGDAESRLDGPLGPGAAIGAPPPDEGSTCAPNVTPPAPAICACAPQACAAR